MCFPCCTKEASNVTHGTEEEGYVIEAATADDEDNASVNPPTVTKL